jgi:hypothetical protein
MNTIISGETEQSLQTLMEKLSSELVSHPDDMLNVLAESKEHGTAVGILAPALGDQMFVTVVDEILLQPAITVVLRSYDKTGYMLETNKLKLTEIKSVYPFRSPFENPYLRELTHDQDSDAT